MNSVGLTGFDLYALAHPQFYEAPECIQDEARRWSALDIGAGRRTEGRDVWVRVSYGNPLPAQGWKIHVSATADNAEAALRAVAAICARRQTDFKYLRSSTLLSTFNSKYAHRGSAGKFIAIYPVDEADLKDLLEELSTALQGFTGPYILSDLRWSDSSPVFIRYGGFAELWVDGDDGKRVMAITAPDGTLVPDRRAPFFEVPGWLDVPGFVQERIDEFSSASRVDMPYTQIEPLHFSNGGGVYLATDPDTGDRVVLKEARPLAGTDGKGQDAVTRLQREHTMLLALAGTGYVPKVFGYHVLWEHHFLVQEYVDGDTLTSAVLTRHPLRRTAASDEDIRDYAAWADETISKVETALHAVHREGIVFGDVHPNNILVRPDGRITLIDLEAAHAVTGERTGLHGAPGFAAPLGTSGVAIDEHALAALRVHTFMPLMTLAALDPDKPAQLVRWAEDVFGAPAGAAGQAARRLDRLHDRTPAQAQSLEHVAPADQARLIAAGINASATPDRSDRLFPGAPASTTPHGAIDVQHGAAGVLYALHAAGLPIDDTWTKWLTTAAVRRAATAPLGLFDGLHGIATVLDLLGRRDEATDLLARAGTRDLPSGLDLPTGLPGIGISLLGFHLRTGDPAYLRQAEQIAEQVAGSLAGHPLDSADLTGGVGGAALLLARMHQHTSEHAYLEQARHVLVAATSTTRTGDGEKTGPSLATGAAGAGLALATVLAHQPDDELTAALDQTLTSACLPLTLTPGLFDGTAGQLYALSVCGDPRASRLAQILWRYAVPHQEAAAMPGGNLMRLSMDLATGGAGALLALESHRSGVDLLGPLLAA
ncbi:class III lanthionine synthetase LanKC [Streptomyces sp. NPDC017868]|uniref:class III lanthionine synthetase LanKC n=1 Tax=Streptomyces sp. NPDC017868 TaxID=3365014 RepID=UPI0037AF58FA